MSTACVMSLVCRSNASVRRSNQARACRDRRPRARPRRTRCRSVRTPQSDCRFRIDDENPKFSRSSHRSRIHHWIPPGCDRPPLDRVRPSSSATAGRSRDGSIGPWLHLHAVVSFHAKKVGAYLLLPAVRLWTLACRLRILKLARVRGNAGLGRGGDAMPDNLLRRRVAQRNTRCLPESPTFRSRSKNWKSSRCSDRTERARPRPSRFS